MRDGGRDFRTGVPIEASTFLDERIDIHHIFPERCCKSATPDAIQPATYNSIINKPAISARTNRQIGGHAPSDYLPAIETAADIEPWRMDQILASHCIAPEHLRNDDFWGFYATRAEMLLQRIETATGKKIPREAELFGEDREPDSYDDGPPLWDAEEALADLAS